MIPKARSLLFAIALVLLPLELSAQNAVITGTVRSRNMAPVPGAYVELPGLELSAVTNDAGVYRLLVLGDQVRGQQETLRVSSIGFRPVEVAVTIRAGAMTQDITLSENAIALDELVVTGTTVGSQQRRAQAATISTVNAAEVAAVAPVSSVTDILQSRVPGISVTQSAGTSGASQQIRIRGASSISLSNEPLVFVDGILADSRARMPFFTGGQASSRLFDINPEDIESIEIVKGPAAATLYGADASAGVIQIITKKGRVGANRFTQTVSMEYNSLENTWTPPSGFAECTAAVLAEPARYTGCAGKAEGTIISDNPMVREDVFRTGEMRSLSWSGRGGGDNYGYFLSLNTDLEDGILPNNAFDRQSGRLNFNWAPDEKLRIDAGFGLIRVINDLPDNDNNIYGFLGGALLGTPLTVGAPNNGWYATNRDSEAIANISNRIETIRTTPTLTATYNPWDLFTNRLTVGADFSREESQRFFPKNDNGWYGGALNTGSVDEDRRNYDVYTVDYQGNVRTAFGAEEQWTSDLTLGMQIVSTRTDNVGATGTGLVTNKARVVSAASQISGNQFYSAKRGVGYLANWTLGWQNRAFLQLGGRIDKNSAFGEKAPSFFLPKVGFSYVVSEEPFWQDNFGFINTFRVRAAFGTTGRSPDPGASLETYDPAPYAISASGTGAGVIPLNPGNLDLKAERGEEFEAGFDAGLLDDRLGLELTYFHKVTKDLLLEVPLAPSQGFDEDPWDNIGEVLNSGFEVALNGTIISRDNVAWDARLGFNTLHNELVSLGDVAPFGTLNRFTEGQPLGAFYSLRIKEFDLEGNRAIVSDTAEFIGNLLPTFEGSFGTNLTLFRNLRLYGQLDWKNDFKIYNNTDQFRERQFATGERRVKIDELPAEERLARFGPFITEGVARPQRTASVNEVFDRYVQDGSFVRLREVSLTYSLPRAWSNAFRASGASLTLGGRNLAIWTDYEGADPELLSAATQGFSRSEFLSIPPARRLVARLNLQF